MKERTPYLIIFTDGASRGNPGDSAYAFIIYDKNLNLIYQKGNKIGLATNNVAEYKAVIEALKWVAKNIQTGNAELHFFLDSSLTANQLSLKFKVKDANLKKLFLEAKAEELKINGIIKYNLIPREKNKEADKLVNKALDNLI